MSKEKDKVIVGNKAYSKHYEHVLDEFIPDFDNRFHTLERKYEIVKKLYELYEKELIPLEIYEEHFLKYIMFYLMDKGDGFLMKPLNLLKKNEEIKNEAYYLRTGEERPVTLQLLKIMIELHQKNSISHETLMGYILKYAGENSFNINQLTIKLPRRSGKSTMIKNIVKDIKDKKALILTNTFEQLRIFKELEDNKNIDCYARSSSSWLGKKYDLIFLDNYDTFGPSFKEEQVWPSLNQNGIIFKFENEPSFYSPLPQSDEPINVIKVDSNNENSVINSLKRLERMGDEESKTVQKLINSANEVANKICLYLKDSNLKRLTLDSPYYTIEEVDCIGKVLVNQTRNIAFARIPENIGSSELSKFFNTNKPCDLDGSIALSKDLKNGLIDRIIKGVETYKNVKIKNKKEVEEALNIFKNFSIDDLN